MCVHADEIKRSKRLNKQLIKNQMNPNVNFNHSKKTTTKALGIKDSSDELTLKTIKLIREFILIEKPTLSRLAESIHENLPYNVILLIATMGIKSDMDKAVNKLIDDDLRSIDLKEIMELLRNN
jgi:hypothetical protein